MDEINKIPPVTRTLIFSTAIVTLGPLLKIVNPYLFLLWWPAVLRNWQVWRPCTAFFLGSGDIQLLFDIFMLLRNSTDLETNFFYRKTSEYTWALLIINSLILATNYPLKSTVLFSPFTMALTYLWSRANPGMRVSFFGLISCPAPYLPYAYLLLDLLRGGTPLAIQSSTGLLSAYIYYFLREILPASNDGRGPKLLPGVPSILRAILPDSSDPATQGQAPPPGGSVRSTGWGGTAYAPAGRNWGDTPAPDPSIITGGQRLNSTRPGIIQNMQSWLPFGGRSSGQTAGSSGAPRRTSGPDREAMLAAAEARLRSLRENSIAGRNETASALARAAANSKEAQARQNKAAPTTMMNNFSTQSESHSTGVQRNESSAQVRKTAASTSANKSLIFGQYADKSKNHAEEENETASGSGGRVAEIRRGAIEPKAEKEPVTESQEHSWGSGRKLGG